MHFNWREDFSVEGERKVVLLEVEEEGVSLFGVDVEDSVLNEGGEFRKCGGRYLGSRECSGEFYWILVVE